MGKKTLAMALAVLMAMQGSSLALFTQNYDVPPEGAPVPKELSFTTYCDIAYQGQLLAVDSQGDDIAYQVETAPKKGRVEVSGNNFVYTPIKGEIGNDRFTYVAMDSQGNCSAPATVLVEIETVKTDVSYADTTPVEAAAAQHLAEEGVFAGTKIGDTHYFEPERSVTRSEFLAMAMEVADVAVEPVSLTCFCDDGGLSDATKGYVSTAVGAGYVMGLSTPEGMAFQGTQSITFSQAATMLNRVLGVEDVALETWYPQATTVHWADQAVGNLEAVDVLAVGSFGSQTLEEPLNRGQAALMLSAAQTYLDTQKPGLFDWLF